MLVEAHHHRIGYFGYVLHHHDDTFEAAVEAVHLCGDVLRHAVPLPLDLEYVLRPDEAVCELSGLAAHLVAHVGYDVGDGSRVEADVYALALHELDPREGCVLRGDVLVGAGAVAAYVLLDILLHQIVSFGREGLVRHGVDLELHALCRLAHHGGVAPEEQRVGQAGEGAVHARAEDPRVGQRHVGDGLHGGRDGGARDAYLPAYGAYAQVDVGVLGHGVGGRDYVVREVVVEGACHDPHAGVVRGYWLARRERHLEQRAARHGGEDDGRECGAKEYVFHIEGVSAVV